MAKSELDKLQAITVPSAPEQHSPEQLELQEKVKKLSTKNKIPVNNVFFIFFHFRKVKAWSIVQGQDFEPKKINMLIGEVAVQTGFSKDTIRYYEKIGLIKFAKWQRGENNYRQFDETMLHRLFQIKSLKNFGFTLNEIKYIFLLDEKEMISCNNLSGLIHEKITTINLKIKALEAVKQKLNQLAISCQGDCKNHLEIN